ncbi:MAG: hypothetical protein ACP6IU_06235 [Candidatus Asgardarchaeia archaeon]
MPKRTQNLFLRDILESIECIEEYTFGIDLQIVWETIQKRTTELKTQIKKILEEIEK